MLLHTKTILLIVNCLFPPLWISMNKSIQKCIWWHFSAFMQVILSFLNMLLFMTFNNIKYIIMDDYFLFNYWNICNAWIENELDQPTSPSLKKTEEKGVIVVHEVKCKVYVKVIIFFLNCFWHQVSFCAWYSRWYFAFAASYKCINVFAYLLIIDI